MFDFIKKPINFVFILHLLLVFLISIGEISRSFSLAILAMLAVFIISQPLKNSVLLFARSIPFYIALPLTPSFDSFNMWRAIVALIFLKWFFDTRSSMASLAKLHLAKNTIKNLWKKYNFEILGLSLFIIAFVSLFNATYIAGGMKRLVYFINLSLLFPVIVWCVKNKKIEIMEISKNIALSIALIVIFGFLQLISTYYLNLLEFMMFWAKQIQLGFYGSGWSEIVYSSNTWFSYNIGFPKLRMFSTFPDSHTFPLYILFGLPAIIAISYGRIKNIKSNIFNKNILLIFFSFLALVLSGTRGIWLAVLFPLVLVFLTSKYPKLKIFDKFLNIKNSINREIIKKTSATVLVFFLAFGVGYIILRNDQFLFRSETSQEQGQILKRVASIIDISETSNNLRIEIWKKSLVSIKKNPFLGVGIGNFPVVLSQNISALKAGSSAHNLYLNIFAETGIFSLIIFIALCALILKYSMEIFRESRDEKIKVYAYASVLYMLWIFGYNLTDAALYDEREFLMFILAIGIIVGLKRQLSVKIIQ